MDFILATGIVWILSALIVNPIAKALTESKKQKVESLNGQVSQRETSAIEVDTGYYILTDVTVLGIAGFLIGLLSGWFFIGISFKAKGWPGMIAFIIGSFLGSSLRD